MSGIERVKLEQALKITRRMYENPAFGIFRDPVPATLPGYYSIIKNPQDLHSILNRLESGKYLSFDNWMTDMKLIFSNSRKFNEQDEVILDYTNQCQNIFEKFVKEINHINMSQMSEKILNQVVKLEKLFKSAPPSVRSILPKDDKYTHDQLSMNSKEKANLLEKINNFTNPDDILKVTQIMEHFGIPINSEHGGIINFSADKLTDEVYWYLGSAFGNK